jgi:hypothetical protein
VVIAAFPNSKSTGAVTAADVAAAFGGGGTPTTTRDALGLIVPAKFDGRLHTGTHLQLSMNESAIKGTLRIPADWLCDFLFER